MPAQPSAPTPDPAPDPVFDHRVPDHVPDPAPARPAPRTARETALGLVAATTHEDPGALADFYAPRVVIEMPFAPAALYPRRIETTREELRARFRAGAAVRRYERVDGVRVHATADPEVAVAEYTLTGRMLADGEPFTLEFAMFLTVRDGLVVHSRDYADPLAGARVLGRLPALLASLASLGQVPETAPLGPEDRAALTELAARHGHLVDAGALDRLDEVFTPDVTYDLTGLGSGHGILRGLDALREAALALGPRNPVGHHVTNTVLDPLPDGRVALLSKGIGVLSDGSCGSVTYQDTAVRGQHGWRIDHRAVRDTPRAARKDQDLSGYPEG